MIHRVTYKLLTYTGRYARGMGGYQYHTKPLAVRYFTDATLRLRRLRFTDDLIGWQLCPEVKLKVQQGIEYHVDDFGAAEGWQSSGSGWAKFPSGNPDTLPAIT